MARSGDKIGPYTLIRRVGRGGFGEVWLAEKKTRLTTTEFALKLALEEDPDIDAIQQEAELWKQASGHPNILPIIEADIYGDYVVIVSEFARGGSLEGWLKIHQGAAPSIDAAVEMISGILSGLEYLHGLRIIHRDLKPANILLQGDRPRLADFGLARVLKSSIFSQTVAGTPEYMAPEAFLNERSEQTDLWAMGVMLYQLLIGQLPFPLDERMSPWQKMAVITSQDIIPPPLNIPEPLREVIIHSLQKKPEQRYESASKMHAAIKEAIESIKLKAKEQPAAYPLVTVASVEETKPPVFSPSPLQLTEPLAQEPALDLTSIEGSVPLEISSLPHKDLKPDQTGPAFPLRTEPEDLEQAESFKSKRNPMVRWLGIVGGIVLVIGLLIAAVWKLSSRKDGSVSVNTQTTSPSFENAKPNGDESKSPLLLKGFDFDTVTVNSGGSVMSRSKGQAQYFTEYIFGVPLEMVEIPGGMFLMGTSDAEAQQVAAEYKRFLNNNLANQLVSWERPQHTVTVSTFYMGKYEVTQAQWRAVATRLPKVKTDLNHDPSHFKGDDLPVESVSWEDAIEFCARLSRATGREYRLPSEAEWEYACRAGTTTLFAFGDTITPEFVNYDGSYPYASASDSIDRGKTTLAGYLGVANAFGLYDMHGNVWEFCHDTWHENYKGAPSDGSVWTGGNKSSRVLRGGSWGSLGSNCRSAPRGRLAPGLRYNGNGFRIALAARTQ